MKRLFGMLALIAWVLQPALVHAQSPEEPAKKRVEIASEDPNKNHEAAVFLGASNTDGLGSAFAMGPRYEYRLPNSERLLGVGLHADLGFYNNSSGIIVTHISLHPWSTSFGHLRGTLGVGLENGLNGGNSNLVLKFGLGWTFNIYRYVIVPFVDANLIGQGGRNVFSNFTVTNFGAAFGYRF